MLTSISSALEEIEGRPDQGAGGRLAATGVTPVAFREQCGSLSQGRPRQGLQTSASALRATAPDPGPDHTQDKMQSPQHGPARAVLPVSPHLVPLCPCSGWPLSWPGCLGQDSPNHRAFAHAAPPCRHHSGLSLDVSSPDRSSWSKYYLFPYHITLRAIFYDMAHLKVAICPLYVLWGPP